MTLIKRPALIASCCVLAAGGTGAAALASTAGAATPAASATGTGTVTRTNPAGKSHTRHVPVSCKVADGHYVVRLGKHRGRGVSMRLRVKTYNGPGSYTARGVIVHRGRHGFRGHDFTAPVTLTSTGGTVKETRTLSGKRHHKLAGKTVTVAASWTCTA